MTDRVVTHKEAKEAALRLIGAAFGSPTVRARFSIPFRADDDDATIIAYINQQAVAHGEGSEKNK